MQGKASSGNKTRFHANRKSELGNYLKPESGSSSPVFEVNLEPESHSARPGRSKSRKSEAEAEPEAVPEDLP